MTMLVALLGIQYWAKCRLHTDQHIVVDGYYKPTDNR
jgi:hypothetical protein